MHSASFRFGLNTKHRVDIECGYFGREKYFVDRVLVLSHWSLRCHGIRSFKFNGHDIQVAVDITRTAAHGKAFVDGECVAADLFAEFNARLAKFSFKRVGPDSNDAMAFVWKCGSWLACVLAIFAVLQYFD